MLKHSAKEFCMSTYLHGFKFIVLPRRILLERTLWTVLVIVSLITSLILLWLAWIEAQRNLTGIITDSTHYPIWNFRFPAVTVCNFNKISRNKAEEFANSLKRPENLTSQELTQELRLLFQLIDINNDLIPQENFTRLQDILDANDVQADQLLKMMAPKCIDMMIRCKWKGEEKRCESIFEQIKTTEGFCCSFNYYALKNHVFAGAMAHKVPKKPRRLAACGYQTGLEVVVSNDPNNYFATQIPSYGHRILIHNPYEFPDWGVQDTVLVAQNELDFISVVPERGRSVDEIKYLSVSQRKCLFGDDMWLHNFRRYSYINCMTECRMNLTWQICGCLPFYNYNENATYHGKIRICNLRDISCLNKNKRIFKSSTLGYIHSNTSKTYGRGIENVNCSCPPECEYFTYGIEQSVGPVSLKSEVNFNPLYDKLTIANHSVFRIFFNDLVGKRNTKVIHYYWHNLMAIFGGLLGIFTGASIISAMEVVYYFTIHLWSQYMQNKNHKTPNKNLRYPADFKMLQVKPYKTIKSK